MENLELEVESPVTSASSTDDNRVARPIFRAQYDNFIGGKWVAPVRGQYFENPSPIDGNTFTKVARSTKEDVELALDAAHEAFASWSKTSAITRSNLLL